MDYVYLPIQSGFRIRKSTMISVLNDIIAAENGNVDMREIGAKYGLSRYERHAVEDFLQKYLVFDKYEMYKSYKTLAEGILEIIEAGAFKDLKTNMPKNKNDNSFELIKVSILLLQMKLGINFPLAAKIFNRLDERGLIVRDENGSYFNLGASNYEE